MADHEYVLMLALHADVADAAADLADLTERSGVTELVAGSAILHRTPTGATVQQIGGGTLAYGIGTGLAVGVVAGVPFDQPLVGGAIGAVVGGLLGRRTRRREVSGLVGLLDDQLPVGSIALVAVVPAVPWPLIRVSLDRALRVTGWPLDRDSPLLPFARSLVRGNPTVSEELPQPARRFSTTEGGPEDPDGRTDRA